EELFHAVVACAERVAVRVIPPADIDRHGLHKSNLAGLRAMLEALLPADACLVDGFRLGPEAPEHRAVVDGDEKSAAIAAASIVACVDSTLSIRRTASRSTSATSRRGTPPQCAEAARRPCTA